MQVRPDIKLITHVNPVVAALIAEIDFEFFRSAVAERDFHKNQILPVDAECRDSAAAECDLILFLLDEFFAEHCAPHASVGDPRASGKHRVKNDSEDQQPDYHGAND